MSLAKFFRRFELVAAILISRVVWRVASQDASSICHCSLTRDALQLQCNNLNDETFKPSHDEAQIPCQFQLPGFDKRLNNNHSDVPSFFFENVTSLTSVILEYSHLQTIPRPLFHPLKELIVLDLSNNFIESLDGNQFIANVNLRDLGLANNRLSELPGNLLANNVNLEYLSLMKNQNLSALPVSLFQSTKLLHWLDLGGCSFTQTSLGDVFHSLDSLEILHLDRNQLEGLNQETFSRLKSLSELDLSKNRLGEIGAEWFANMSQLETLNLSDNRIESIATEAFSGLWNLKRLDLGGNQLSSLSDTDFHGLRLLEELTLCDNRLTLIESLSLKPLRSLRKISLARNNLTFSQGPESLEFGLQSPLSANVYLDWIDLSGNRIAEFCYDWHMFHSLSYLNLSQNQLSSLNFYDLNLSPSGGGLVLDLRFNRIRSIDFSGASVVDRTAESANKTLLVDENPLNCDCGAYYLARYMNGTMDHVMHTWKIHAPNLKCQNSPLVGARPANVDPNLFLCPCPSNGSPCLCQQRPADRALLFHCDHRHLIDIPKIPHIPGTNVLFNLSSNSIDLKTLAENDTFPDVTHLDLSRNFIDESMISMLNWSRVFSFHFPSVEYLDLSYNNLGNIPYNVIDAWNRTEHVTVSLRGNPWHCDIHIYPLLDYMISYPRRFRDTDDINCSSREPLTQWGFPDRQRLYQMNTFIILAIIANVCLVFLALFLIICLYGPCVNCGNSSIGVAREANAEKRVVNCPA